MNVKNEGSPLEILRGLLADQKGLLLTSDLVEYQIPRTYLKIMENNGEIERISHGVYAAASAIEDDLFYFQLRYKVSIYSHETALFLHDLSDRAPLSHTITVPSQYHAVSLPQSGCKIFYLNRRLLGLGAAVIKSPQGNDLRVTGLERTICDILRSRNQMDVQLVNDGLKRAVKLKTLDLNRLYQLAGTFGIQKILRQTIEILL